MKYALIGCGCISPNYIVAVLKNGLDFVAVCDVVKENMEDKIVKFELPQSVKQYVDYREMNAQK